MQCVREGHGTILGQSNTVATDHYSFKSSFYIALVWAGAIIGAGPMSMTLMASLL